MGREGGLASDVTDHRFFPYCSHKFGGQKFSFFTISVHLFWLRQILVTLRGEYCFYPDDLCYSVISRKFLYSRNRDKGITMYFIYIPPHGYCFVQYFYASCCLRKFVQFLIKSTFRVQIPYGFSFHAEGSTVQPRYNEPRSNKFSLQRTQSTSANVKYTSI